MQPKLSICIPTYNRANYLNALLKSIVSQYEPYKNIIEILVCNNCSTDNTEEVVKKYLDEGVKLKYFKHEKNTGLDYNVYYSFLHASGEYVWIFGDDDELLPGGLAAIMSILSRGEEYGIIHVKAIPYRGSIRPKSIEIKRVKTIRYDANNFARRIHTMFSFITGNIINKEIYSKYYDFAVSAERYLGTNLVFLEGPYKLLIVATKFLYISTPLTISKSDNSGGYKFFETFSKNIYEVAASALKGHPRLIRIIINGTITILLPFHVVGRERLTSFSQEEDICKMMQEALGKFSYFWFFIYPLLKLKNVFLIRCYIFGIKIFNFVNKKLGNLLL
jgi:glycosyltransferase involved in cell wall biosynthesis